MNIKQMTIALSVLLLSACGGSGGGGTPVGGGGGAGGGGGGSTTNVSGQYTVTMSSTARICDGGITLPASPVFTDTQTVVQTGNTFTVTSEIAPGGKTSLNDCPLNSDLTFACEETNSTGSATTNSKNSGSFTATSLTGKSDVILTSSEGRCTWTANYVGVKI